jgi:hypothetical protein
MTKSEKAELLKLVHKCALLVCEARNFLEELEQIAIELDDYLAEQVE